jgi:hypothetical protein
MAIDSSASQVATNALQAIPFGSIIGGPLTACVEAQAMAAETTWEFIQKVGLQTDDKGNKKAVNVQFEYVQGGSKDDAQHTSADHCSHSLYSHQRDRHRFQGFHLGIFFVCQPGE